MSEGKGPRVLLADDEEKLIKLLSQRLETRGHKYFDG
jgi:CheY-like chemotaxis protein